MFTESLKSLPIPTGPYQIGIVKYDLVDQFRKEINYPTGRLIPIERQIALAVSSKVSSLDLSNTNVTDEQLKLLSHLEHINLTNCKCVTNEGVQSLVNLKSLNISACDQLTDEAIKHLVGLKELFK